jgi:hypothetical protein
MAAIATHGTTAPYHRTTSSEAAAAPTAFKSLALAPIVLIMGIDGCPVMVLSRWTG